MDSEAFSVENGLTTPTFKHKRPQLLQHYKKEVDECVQIARRTSSAPDVYNRQTSQM